jgi:hypothetical protein
MNTFFIIFLLLFNSELFASEFLSGKEKNNLLLENLRKANVESWLYREGNNNNVPTAIPFSWDSDEFTDPVKHNEKDFIYVVTAIREFFDFRRLTSRVFGSKGRAIFASLINSVDTDTFRNSGLILKIHPEHIIGSSLFDTGFNFSAFNSYDEAISAYSSNFGIYNPTEVYLGSLWNKYFTKYGLKHIFNIQTIIDNNEVLLHGIDVKGRAVEITGVFIKENVNEEDHVNRGLVAFAKKQNLPIVKIPDIKRDFFDE